MEMIHMTRLHTTQLLQLSRLLIVALVASLGLIADADAQSELRFGAPGSSTGNHLSFENVSHAPFDALLRRYVDCDGMVCYRQWRDRCRDIRGLEAYLHSLTQIDASIPARREAKIAYYINAYNAMTLWGILHEYPVASIQRIDGKRTKLAIFDDVQLWDGTNFVSLNGIENDVLRPMGDPRIHFALVCAARGCPRLRNRAYTADSLHWQLDDNAREFFSSHSRFHVSRLTGRVYMSPILDWYRDDFGQTDYEVISTLFAYLPARDRQWLTQHCDWKLKYLGYDWSLNDRCPTAGVKLAAIPYHAYSKISPLLKPFKSMMPSDANESGRSCDGCDGAAPQELGLAPFAPDEFASGIVPDQL
jgi:hypothetical protein